MFSISNSRYFLFRPPTDMRKSFDGLCGIISGRLGQDPVSGDIFIFVNRQRNMVKLLRWEIGGFILFYKRLEKGTFELPDEKNGEESQTIGYGELAMIITGISLKNTKKRTRF